MIRCDPGQFIFAQFQMGKFLNQLRLAVHDNDADILFQQMRNQMLEQRGLASP